MGPFGLTAIPGTMDIMSRWQQMIDDIPEDKRMKYPHERGLNKQANTENFLPFVPPNAVPQNGSPDQGSPGSYGLPPETMAMILQAMGQPGQTTNAMSQATAAMQPNIDAARAPVPMQAAMPRGAPVRAPAPQGPTGMQEDFMRAKAAYDRAQMAAQYQNSPLNPFGTGSGYEELQRPRQF